MAFVKMSESRLRRGDCFSDVLEYGDGVREPFEEKDVSSGERSCI